MQQPKMPQYMTRRGKLVKRGAKQVATPAQMSATLWMMSGLAQGLSLKKPVAIRLTVLKTPSSEMSMVAWFFSIPSDRANDVMKKNGVKKPEHNTRH